MSEPLWLYKWIDSSGTTHITTSYHEANEALHSRPNQFVFGSRYREPAPTPDLPDRPWDPVEPDDEEEVF